jgi:hypothetical protein
MNIERIAIMPRWSGHADVDWYPWFRQQLAGQDELRVHMLALDQPGAPTIDGCVASLTAALGDDPRALERTLLIGHSVGCQALLRYLAALPSEVPGGPAHLICVAGWWAVDEPWATIRPWIETPHAVERLRARTGKGVTVVLSDNDPFTADWQANSNLWKDRLGARVELVAGGRHFNGAEAPLVLELVRELLG